MPKPFSQACENNKRPILEVLTRHLGAVDTVLEIGSGTGQHAVFFGECLPHLVWQTSDRRDNHAGIDAWLADAGLGNVEPPLDLDVDRKPWPVEETGAVFSANTAHIMGWTSVRAFVSGVGRILRAEGLFLLYGPFNYGGRHTSESNARFDRSLRLQDAEMGIRDFETLDDLARAAGMELVEDNVMPANNRLLVWRKAPTAAS
jgi:hypothetical protein